MRSVLLLLVIAACDEPVAAIDAGVDAPIDAPSGQGSEPTSALIVNEVSPRGGGSDWIELKNRGDAAIDLCGFFLTDAADRLDHYLPLGGVMPPEPCAPVMLEPGAYRVIELDGTPLPASGPIDPLHAPFELAAADEVHIVSIAGGSIDGVLFLYPRAPSEPADVTLARIPDGEGLFFAAPPTPAAANPAVRP